MSVFKSCMGVCVHHVLPALIVVVALWCHVKHNPMPLLTLVVLLSGAYGRSVWSEFLRSRAMARVQGGVEGGQEGGGRDVPLGVEPTR
jgi:hypothetical protein